MNDKISHPQNKNFEEILPLGSENYFGIMIKKFY